jgi:hypothetical protein
MDSGLATIERRVAPTRRRRPGMTNVEMEGTKK